MRARFLLALAALLAALAPLAAASAEERIRSFVSDVRILPDGTLDVTETIRIVSEGDQVRRGILRDFPTRYERDGRRIRVGFDVLGVTRNGEEERWSTESLSNGVRIRIGHPDRMLSMGEHEYVIRYRTTDQIGFFDGYDELYWNATGTGWTFPIDVAEARIELPVPAPWGETAAYTGAQGSRDRSAEVVEQRPGTIRFRTTAPLAAGEGLTVAAAFPKGIVPPPPPRSEIAEAADRYAPALAAAAGLVLVLSFYFYAWLKAGRGPRAGPMVPIFSPPDALSAAATRFLRRMGFDNRAFAAALIESGVRGRLRIEEEGGSLFSKAKSTLHKTGRADVLAPPERAMFNRLFQSRDRLRMDKENYKAFQDARGMLKDGLEEAWRGKAFERHYDWALYGFLLMLGASLFTAGTVFAVDRWLDGALMLIPAGGIAFLVLAWAIARGAVRSGNGGFLLWAGFALCALAALVANFAAAAFAGAEGRALPVLVPFLALPVAISAFWWMSAPTKQGRALMDRIAGFRHYLAVAEEDRLETLHPPEKTPELFERYLPYAIALGVENRWARKFEGVLARAAAAEQEGGGRMHWYSGRHSPWTNPGRFATAVGAGLASSVASASTAPGSSSGSGGGGSSGGGGGGGGGSGW